MSQQLNRPPMTGNMELAIDQLMQICLDFIRTLKSQSAPWVLQRLNNTGTFFSVSDLVITQQLISVSSLQSVRCLLLLPNSLGGVVKLCLSKITSKLPFSRTSSFAFLPSDLHSRFLSYRITSVRERLRLIVFWIEQFRSSWWYSRGCELLFPSYHICRR